MLSRIRSIGFAPEFKKQYSGPEFFARSGKPDRINAPIPQWFFPYLVMRIIGSFLILNHPERFL
jgi:hypothetical protein